MMMYLSKSQADIMMKGRRSCVGRRCSQAYNVMCLSKSQDDDLMITWLSKSQDGYIMMMRLSKSQEDDLIDIMMVSS